VNKKGMELWFELTLIVLAVILLVVMFVWYKDLATSASDLFGKLGSLL